MSTSRVTIRCVALVSATYSTRSAPGASATIPSGDTTTTPSYSRPLACSAVTTMSRFSNSRSRTSCITNSCTSRISDGGQITPIVPLTCPASSSS